MIYEFIACWIGRYLLGALIVGNKYDQEWWAPWISIGALVFGFFAWWYLIIDSADIVNAAMNGALPPWSFYVTQ